MGSLYPKSVPPPITTLEAEHVEDLEMATVVGTATTIIPTATANVIPTATTRDLAPRMAPTTDPKIA